MVFTPEEQAVMDHLTAAIMGYAALPATMGSDKCYATFLTGIDQAQAALFGRLGQRTQDLNVQNDYLEVAVAEKTQELADLNTAISEQEAVEPAPADLPS